MIEILNWYAEHWATGTLLIITLTSCLIGLFCFRDLK